MCANIKVQTCVILNKAQKNMPRAVMSDFQFGRNTRRFMRVFASYRSSTILGGIFFLRRRYLSISLFPTLFHPLLREYFSRERCRRRSTLVGRAPRFASFARMFTPLGPLQLVKGEPAENISTYRLQNAHGRR